MVELQPLPYGYDALEPLMSREALAVHHAVLQQGYVDTLNGSGFSPEKYEFARRQNYNHDLFWESMSPVEMVVPHFLVERQEEFVEVGLGIPASGWVWLVLRDGDIYIEGTSNADQPEGGQLLMVCDVWEHTYYLDWQARRGEWLRAWWNVLANWETCEPRLADEG